ncbi:hypothetical protein [Stenotrophomonas sp. SY1]|jgi:hypothetical protein|uniref:hypothetical protein n=1 Tax=Stenotrophomonas sp. SY1 TaxID=477235 RepID=UPI001E34F769|nr:hypothetical protein [Stenotrophomonas sp. SY1]MCD9088439.1 hypothetical protein [Stenotrophomonas sp. SY1]
MNLVLHYGLLGSLEAALIALAIGFVVFALWWQVCRRVGLSHGHAIAWACLVAVIIGAGVDAWNMFYLGMMGLESPLYVRLALARIHDPDQLGTRVVLEVAGAMIGVGLGWWMFSSRPSSPDTTDAS